LKIARAISVILITSILVSVITTAFSTIIISTPIATAAAQTLSTIEKRDVTVDLEPGGMLQTKGELIIPAAGDGPFPAVLLIHGSGATDRDEYLPPMVT
jgi:uncharacterized protein